MTNNSPSPARASAGSRRAGGPLYAKIRDALRQQIEVQSIPPGATLPTEEALQARYGVSRSVVRQALGELVDLGLISRQRGRGSVVAPQPEHHRRAAQAGGLAQQFAASGQDLRTEVLKVVADEAPPPAAAALGSSEAWRLERLRSVDDEPLVFMRTWLPRHLFPVLSAEDLDGGSLHAWMRERGVLPSGGPRQVQAVPCEDVVAQRLDIPVGTPVLLLQGVTADPYDNGLEWFSAWHRPGTIFDIDAQVAPPGNGAPSRGLDVARIRTLVEELEGLLPPRS